ncbi:D-sedoheptulose-7-phosphate isomerase [Planosporangium sp. 12N6]|uniref:D-sedoheptulose-7-phosphate isomerase n=1 Tax=Planosporangium spinosum TaxID=3402278 RepID=UPI003CF34CE6
MTLLSGNEARSGSADDAEDPAGGPAAAALDPVVDRQLDTVWRRSAVDAKLDRLAEAVDQFRAEAPRLARWGEHLARVLVDGGRLLVAGNGGSAAEAQHLTAELVGKLHDDRPAYSAIALTAETSSLTAIGNDYGYERVFARQVEAHGRPGDVLILISGSGRSRNLIAAAETARERGVTSWAMTGALPNPLAMCCDDALAIQCDAQTAQELHLVAVHLVCEQVEAALPATEMRTGHRAGRGVRR